MTATAHAGESSAAQPEAQVASRDTAIWMSVVGCILVGYLLLQNPYWVPCGDSELYITIARNLVTGKGYAFNGERVAQVPPGWPLILAGLMKISPTFLFLKFATMGMLVAALAVMYRICRRYASGRRAAAAVLLAAVLSNVYQASFWLMSDAAFFLISALTILVAQQIREGRQSRLRIAALVLLCAVGVFIRWAGLFTWMVAAAALMDDRPWRSLLMVSGAHLTRRFEWVRRKFAQFNSRLAEELQGWRMPMLDPELQRYVKRCWLAVLLSGAMTAAAFFVTRWAVTVPPGVEERAALFGGTMEEDVGMPLERTDSEVATVYRLWNSDARGIWGYLGRFGSWGDWFSYLFWQPLRVFRPGTVQGLISLLCGWPVLLTLMVQTWRSVRQGQVFWLALLLYTFVLAIGWTHPTSRYLVPVSPLIVLGVLNGAQILREKTYRPRLCKLVAVLPGVFVTTVLLCNGALYAVDVSVARSRDFYSAYEAGLDRELIAACRWLRERPVEDGRICISGRYTNLGRTRITSVGLRKTAMLTERAIIPVRPNLVKYGDGLEGVNLINWCRNRGIKYYLYQEDASPWRVFHFRMRWLQERMTHEPVVEVPDGWRLYEIPSRGRQAVRIDLDPVRNWPTIVPGLEQKAH